MAALSQSEKRFVGAVATLSGLCLGLFLLRLIVTHTSRYWFIPENLVLVWASLVFAWLLVNNLKTRRWLSWQNGILSVLWFAFLPNAWYVLTDFVHLNPTGEISQLYDIVMLSTLVFTGFLLGFASLYLVHKQLYARFKPNTSHAFVVVIILVASFAIYLGRDLRWSTWDLLTNPVGITLDVSDRVIDPFGHPRFLTITGLFFVLLSTMYWAFWQLIGPLKTKPK